MTGCREVPGKEAGERNMLEIINVGTDQVIGVKASGRLTDEDYRKFLPQLEELIRRQGPILLFVDMTEFEGWETKAAWDDLKFGLRHDVDFARIAVVTDRKWLQWMIRASTIFFAAEMRCFPGADRERALQWLQEPETAEEPGPAKPPAPYSHILLATDFSPHADRAAARALELARRYDARLSLVHVVEYFFIYGDFIDGGAVDEFELEQQVREAADKQLQRLAEEMGITDPDQVHLLTGPPKHTLLDFAREHDVDLVVLGSHGRRGVERLLGSVAAGIVNAAPCDVLTVRL